MTTVATESPAEFPGPPSMDSKRMLASRRPSPEEGLRLMRAFFNIRSDSRREAIIKMVLESETESTGEM